MLKRMYCLGTISCLIALMSCSQSTVVVPSSLNGPRAMAVARGEVCLSSVEVAEAIFEPLVTKCDAGQRGSIGLIVNDQLDRLAILDMSLVEPRLVDLDASVPGVTHLKTGRLPVDVTANESGTVAYTANQMDRTLSVFNLWYMRPLETPIELPGTPTNLSWSKTANKVVVGISAPSSLWLGGGVECAEPVGGIGDRRTTDPSKNCTVSEDEAVSVALPFGTLSTMSLSPDGDYAYVLYADRPVMSVVALDEAIATAAGDTCLNGGVVPCEVARIGLTHGCSDGLDNDGDGLIDQKDGQCYGPLHSESTDGLSRKVSGACADGLDNDGDGLTDREDPECVLGSSDSEEMVGPAVKTACNDGVDNDGDGFTDAAEDESCYGSAGLSESSISVRGFTAMGVDELGKFLYVVDGANEQILIVNAATRKMIDAPRSAQPVDGFASSFGVRIGKTPVPTAVTGRVSRAVVSDSDPAKSDTHAVVRYDYGAYVAADNGFVYYIDTARVYCEVTEPDGILSSLEFYEDTEKRVASKEHACLNLPAFPLKAPDVIVENCEEIFLCQQCIEAVNDVNKCAPCEGVEDFDAKKKSCALEHRTFEQDDVKLVVNPRFSLRDRASESGGTVGRAVCEQPTTMVRRLEAYSNENNFKGTLNCGSLLSPQPLSVNVPTAETTRPADFLISDRLDFIEQRTHVLGFKNGVESTIEVKRKDERILSEDINVVYEGAIPQSKRTDGIVVEGDMGLFDVGGLDVCRAGVEVGDLLIIKTKPGTGSGCQSFDDGADDFLTYRIANINDRNLTLEVYAPDGADATFVGELPKRTCFSQALSYEIRPVDTWLVYGSQSGVSTDKKRLDGQCVPTQASLTGRGASRVKTGETYVGLYYSFYLYPGIVEPTRDLSYKMQTLRNFIPASTENLGFLEPDSARPSQILFVDRLPAGRFIFVSDPSDNIIFGQNLATGGLAFGLR